MIPWTVASQAPLSMGFPKQEYQSGLPFPSPGDLPDPAIDPRSPALQADSLLSEPPGKPHIFYSIQLYNYTPPTYKNRMMQWKEHEQHQTKLDLNLSSSDHCGELFKF